MVGYKPHTAMSQLKAISKRSNVPLLKRKIDNLKHNYRDGVVIERSMNSDVMNNV